MSERKYTRRDMNKTGPGRHRNSNLTHPRSLPVPDDDIPEVWVDCEECGGEGAIEIWESVSKWSIDPPGSHYVPCRACNGAGGMICEAA
jgi:hypothetical protein